MVWGSRRSANVYRRSAKARAYDIAYMHRPGVVRRRLNSRLLRAYGITLQQRDELLYQQGNVCAICQGPAQREGFHVDHDHQRKIVRGVLCGNCNKGIGLLRENPTAMARAIAYLLGVPIK